MSLFRYGLDYVQMAIQRLIGFGKKEAIKIKKHGRLSMSLFRYGLDYVQMAIQRLIGFGKKEEFKEILAILRRQNPDRIRVL
ncbi:iS4 family transposase ORF 2 [Acinetobacter baumannii 45057_1]|nr:iS4 family transposase ORF 2 [Acinetobacter baumannii 45057_1]